jgi:hypothetical protein
MDQASREEWIHANINEIGWESFPDNLEETWTVIDIQHDADVSFVEAEATPVTVGYPRFKFVLDFTNPTSPKTRACQALKDGGWSLLFGTEEPTALTSGCTGLIGLFPFVLGVIGILVSIYLYSNVRSFLSEAVKTDGTVIKLVKKKSSKTVTERSITSNRSSTRKKTKITFSPVFTFTDHQGQKHEVQSTTGSSTAAYSVNDKVQVYFQKEYPQQAKIDSFFSLWGAAAIVGGASALFCLIGLLFLCVFSKR